MSHLTRTKVRNAVARVRDTWAELDYAQRRATELRTGVPLVDRPVRRVARSVEDLESLYSRGG